VFGRAVSLARQGPSAPAHANGYSHFFSLNATYRMAAIDTMMTVEVMKPDVSAKPGTVKMLALSLILLRSRGEQDSFAE
jgi:hypothetical protein